MTMLQYPQHKPTTYCREMIDGVRCNAVIPITERLCAACQKKKENGDQAVSPLKP
jgi:hypothetical protein